MVTEAAFTDGCMRDSWGFRVLSKDNVQTGRTRD